MAYRRSKTENPKPQIDEIRIAPQPGPQTRFAECEADICIFGGSAGGGKALSVDTPIPTPYGWMANGDINQGDIVFAPDGATCNVVAAHPVMHGRECYEVVFSDGEVIIADEDHLWWVFTDSDRTRAHRLTDEFRSKRRSIREKRGTGKKPWLSELNSKREHCYLNQPIGSVLSTKQIKETIYVKSRKNYSVKVADALDLPEIDLPIDPYILGVWLGDGTTAQGSITTADQEIIDSLEAAGYKPIKQPSNDYVWGTRGLTRRLRRLLLIGNKHIPGKYLRASKSQRLELLRGLMDTDGNIGTGKPGACEYTTTRIELAEGVRELLWSLGIKHSFMVGDAKLYGRITSKKYRFLFWSDECVFRLGRKASHHKKPRKRSTSKWRYIKEIRVTESVPVRCLTVDSSSGCYLAGRAMIPTHNTNALVREPIRGCAGYPGFGAIIFRRTYPQITGTGSVWDEAMKIYPMLGGSPHASSGAMFFRFPNGSTVQFSHLQRDDSVQDHQSKQYPLIMFDQVEQFTEYQFWYMVSRNRSTCGVKPHIRAACNPDPDSFVKPLILWWLDDNGEYARTERQGLMRWMYRIEDTIEWGDSREEMLQRFPRLAADHVEPMSFTFIESKLDDNKILQEKDPAYRSKLMMLPLVERERLLGANWAIKPASGNVFKRDWFEVIQSVPSDIKARIRFWDKAATEESTANKDPDWTAGVKLSVHASGMIVIHDVARTRATPGRVEDTIKNIASQDGKEWHVGGFQDPGQAGKVDVSHFVRSLAGYITHTFPQCKDKVTAAGPLSSQAEHGNIKLLAGAWNEEYIKELVNFPSGAHDDQVDATSGGYQTALEMMQRVPPPPPKGVAFMQIGSADRGF